MSGTGSKISDKDSLSTGAWRLEEEGPEVQNSGHVSWSFFVRDKLLYPHQLTTTASAIHPEIAARPAPEVAYKTSTEHKNHETSSR